MIEVLVALTVASLGILAVTLPAMTAGRNAVSLREESLAHWVAMNHAADLRLAAAWPDTGRSDGDVDFAGREWRWITEISETDVEALRRAEISVVYADDPDQEIAHVVAFIGQPTPRQSLTASALILVMVISTSLFLSYNFNFFFNHFTFGD